MAKIPNAEKYTNRKKKKSKSQSRRANGDNRVNQQATGSGCALWLAVVGVFTGLILLMGLI